MRLAPELKSKIDKLWDKFWSGGLSNPLSSVEQMSYLIFMKRLEDMDVNHQKKALARNDSYKSVFEGNEDCRWSIWKHYTAEKMLDHVRNVVFPFIKNLHNGENALYSEYMKDAVFLIPKPSLLQEAVSIIDELNITSQNIDTQGDIYEYLLSEIKISGKNGQFRTPRHIIRMIIELVEPDIRDLICDPACGTAGFLINAYEYIIRKYTSPEMVTEDEEGNFYGLYGDKITDKRAWELLWSSFYGYDFDSTMVRISLMNMVLHGIPTPNINLMDTLSKRYAEENKYNVVLANPPFKGSIDKEDINDRLTVGTTKTEILFVERMFNLLQIGGRCGVIVPAGVLFGSSNAHKKLRRILLRRCQLEAVISMPSGVFKPYAGVSAAVLVFVKGDKTEKVWFYDMKADGYSLDDKRAFIDGKGDISDIVERFKKRQEENPIDRKGKCFFVPIEEIVDNDYDLSVSKYKEIEYEEIEYEEPEVIMAKIEDMEDKIKEGISELKKLLKEV
ncbi:N-6 DNA methylase [Halobacteriota archaeon]